MEPLHYNDFCNLYVIAIGLSLAYIVVLGEREKFPFRRFLDDMAKKFQQSVKSKIKPYQQEQTTIAQIRFYLNLDKKDDLLNPKTIGALELIANKVTETIDKIKSIDESINKALSHHIKTDYLNVCAFDCTFYSFFLLILGPLSLKCGLHIDLWISFMNCSIVLAVIHCFLYDRCRIQHYPPRILWHSIYFTLGTIIFLLLGKRFENAKLLPEWVTPIICFSNFIVYFAISSIGCFFASHSISKAIRKLNLEKTAQDHADDLKRYKKDLQYIDTALEQLSNNTSSPVVENDSQTTSL